MAAPSYVQASTGATDATGAFTFTGVATGTIGDLVILQIVIDGPGGRSWGTESGTNINKLDGTAGWTDLASTQGGPTAFFSGTGNVQQVLLVGRRTSASSAPTFSTTANTNGDDVYGRMYEFTHVSTGTDYTTVIENGTAGNIDDAGAASATVSDVAVTALGPDRLALNFVGINDDNAVAPFTGMTGGTWGEVVAEYADSGGTDACIQCQAAYYGSFGTGVSAQTSTSVIQGDGGASNEQTAQEFTTVGALTVAYVTLILKKTGTPTDNLVVEFQTNAAGIPSGTVVGTAGTLAGADVLSSTVHMAYRIAVPASLSAATIYHLVFRRDGARDAGNYFQIWNGGDLITGGVESKASGVWSDATANDTFFALQAASDILSGTAIDGGTATNVDATDSWNVVGFALIGTTVSGTTYTKAGYGKESA